jgi:hypothetical protein
MPKRIFAASYERGVQLIAVGCPIAYPDALPGHPVARHKRFHAEQLDGYSESRVYAINQFQTGFVVGLRLWTDRPSGTVITEWSFTPPWEDHRIEWDYEPLEIIPEWDRGAHTDLLDSRLMGVLDDHRLLMRGYPIEGLLCGRSDQPIPESVAGHVTAKLTLSDDEGSTAALRIALNVVRRAAIPSHTFPTRAGRIFAKT